MVFFQITNQNKLAVTYSDVILGWSQKAIESLAYDFGVVKFVFVYYTCMCCEELGLNRKTRVPFCIDIL